MLDAMRHSLIRDPLFSVRDTHDQIRQLNLAEVFVELLQNNIVSFEALQKHQIQAWQSFLAQTAAMALARANNTFSTPPTDVATWQELLVQLSDGEESAWNLFVHDVSRPAFMQSPIPEGSLKKAKYKLDTFTPDDLDILVTAKQHEIKASRIINTPPESWIYALVIAQTMDGYTGSGNYGIIRMNGGYANRPKVGFAPGIAWGEQFEHELSVLLNAYEDLCDGIDGYDPSGAALLWTLPWDGTVSTQLTLQQCDPYFIEICRRVRVVNNFGTLEFWRATTKSNRIDGLKELKGITQDPWVPVETGGAKAFSLSRNGYDYRILQEFLLGDKYQKPLMLSHKPRTNHDWFFIAHGMVRGMGKTEGLHERIVPIPREVTFFMRDNSQRQILADRSKSRVADTEKVRSKVLYASLSTLLGGGVSSKDSGKHADRWTRAFEANVDDVFFPDLWASVDMPPDEHEKAWQKRLYDLAKQQLDDAIASAPMSSMRRYKAIAAARDLFDNSARKQLPALFPKTSKTKLEKAR